MSHLFLLHMSALISMEHLELTRPTKCYKNSKTCCIWKLSSAWNISKIYFRYPCYSLDHHHHGALLSRLGVGGPIQRLHYNPTITTWLWIMIIIDRWDGKEGNEPSRMSLEIKVSGDDTATISVDLPQFSSINWHRGCFFGGSFTDIDCIYSFVVDYQSWL